MDDKKIKHVELTSEGLIVTFDDGCEGLIKGEDVRECIEKTNGFAKLEAFQDHTKDD